jgi:hypothetical protein
MSTGVTSALAVAEERAAAGCPGWETWVVSTHDKRLLWSAQPEGARGAVIYDEPTADHLILAVRKYETDLPAHLEDARRRLASVPHTNIGRDEAAVLTALVASLEKLGARG